MRDDSWLVCAAIGLGHEAMIPGGLSCGGAALNDAIRVGAMATGRMDDVRREARGPAASSWLPPRAAGTTTMIDCAVIHPSSTIDIDDQ